MADELLAGQPPRAFDNVPQARHVHAAVPHQLRPSPAHFTDRVAEIEALSRIAAADPERRGPVVAVINGQGGIGKSALALRWLHAITDDYPDG